MAALSPSGEVAVGFILNNFFERVVTSSLLLLFISIILLGYILYSIAISSRLLGVWPQVGSQTLTPLSLCLAFLLWACDQLRVVMHC